MKWSEVDLTSIFAGVKPIPAVEKQSDAKFRIGELTWIPRIRSSAVIVDIDVMADASGEVLTGCYNYWCVTIKGIQWISEEYIQPFESWNVSLTKDINE